MVKEQQGFEYAAERPAADTFMKQKWGWRATEPGAGQGRAAPCRIVLATPCDLHGSPRCPCRKPGPSVRDWPTPQLVGLTK